MWIIREVKKDIKIMGGCILAITALMYLVIGRLDPSFFRYLMSICIAIMSIGAAILINHAAGKTKNNMFKFLAIMYRYIAVSIIIIMLIINYHGAHGSKEYICFRLGMDVFEMICILIAYKYLNKEFDKAKVYPLSVIFFIAMTYSLFIPLIWHEIGVYLPIITCLIESIVIGLMIFMLYLNYSLRERFDKRIIYRMYLFLGFKGSYHFASILYMNTYSNEGYFVLILFRFIYTYYLISSIFYEKVFLPWHDLIQKVEVTNEQLNDNEKDRNTVINLSHELKTPINVIQSAVDVLKLDFAEDTDKELREVLQSIKKTCYKSTRLITQIIDNNKIDEGYIQPQYMEHNLIAVLENVVTALMRYNPGWKMIFDPEEEEVVVSIDKDLVQRCILNLFALLLHYQTEHTEVYLNVQIRGNIIIMTIKSACTMLPLHAIKSEEAYNLENINEMAAFEFAEKVLKMHGAELTITEESQKQTTISIVFKQDKEIDFYEIQEDDSEENISLLLDRLQMQYADLEDNRSPNK